MLENGVKIFKWPYQEEPTPERVQEEMSKFGYTVYDLQTIPPWFKRSPHSHDYDEIRGVVQGCTTFHFGSLPITVEAGDIILIPAGVIHEVITHNGQPFTAYKGSTTGVRRVTEHGVSKS